MSSFYDSLLSGGTSYATPTTNLYFNANLPQYQSVAGYQKWGSNNTNSSTNNKVAEYRANTGLKQLGSITTGKNIGGSSTTPNGNGNGSGNGNGTSTFAQNAEVGVNIGSSIMNALGGISNMALGWATYAEQKKNSEMQRELAAKQLENLQDIMDQRKKELERLNRVRGNTNKAFKSNTAITRSVL